jgi:hypothetical protein
VNSFVNNKIRENWKQGKGPVTSAKRVVTLGALIVVVIIGLLSEL